MWNFSSLLLYTNCWPLSPRRCQYRAPCLSRLLYLAQVLLCLGLKPRGALGNSRYLAPHGHGWARHYGLAGNLHFDSRETLGKGRNHPVSPDTCGCRQCWREVRLGCHLGHGWFGVANRGRPSCLDRPVPGWASGQGQDLCEPPAASQVIRRLLLHWFRFLMGSRESFKSTDFYHLRVQCMFSDLIVFL